MSTIKDAYWNALLADATYALNVNFGNVSSDDLIVFLKDRMTLPVAQEIAADFTLVTEKTVPQKRCRVSVFWLFGDGDDTLIGGAANDSHYDVLLAA